MASSINNNLIPVLTDTFSQNKYKYIVTKTGVGRGFAYYAYPLYVINWMGDTFKFK